MPGAGVMIPRGDMIVPGAGVMIPRGDSAGGWGNDT